MRRTATRDTDGSVIKSPSSISSSRSVQRRSVDLPETGGADHHDGLVLGDGGRSCRAAGRVEAMEIVAYEARHLDAVVALCKAEGWTTFAGNRERAGLAMGGPGVTALVAVVRGEGAGGSGGGRAAGGVRGPDEHVVGFAQAFGDGCFGGYLAMLLVDEAARGQGVGRALVERALVESGVVRLDLLSSDRAMSLYERFPHIRVPGFRLYPDESLRPPSADD